MTVNTGPEMEEDSLNTASTFVKCALGRSSPFRRAGRLSRARNYSQFRVNESKTIRIAVQTRAPERERKRRGNAESGVKRECRNTHTHTHTHTYTCGRERARSRRTFILHHPGRCPLSAFSPSVSSKSDPGGMPGLTPHLAGEIFKFCHVQV